MNGSAVYAPASGSRVASVGMFDGVHIGHRFLLEELREAARQRGCIPLAVTFRDHPLREIAPQRAPLLLTSPAEKRSLLEEAGVEVLMLDFDERLRSTTAAGFLRMLHSNYGVSGMLLGFNNSFGCDAPSDFGGYSSLAAGEGVELLRAGEFDFRGEAVSSSAIRRMLAAGNVEQAALMLGRPHRLEGTVVDGMHIGRTIGFPTANVVPPAGKAVPGRGVYAAMASVRDLEGRDAGRFMSVVNIGTRPTINPAEDKPQTVEAHLIGWEGNLYGHSVALDFVGRIRGEQKFSSLAALKQQITADCSTGIELLKISTTL